MFRKLAHFTAYLTGTAGVFALALTIVAAWALTGPIFDFSDTWQLVINTFTTISTFLMVFLIQNTQNRDSKAMQLKLDELILSTKGRDAFVDLEDMTDEELDELVREFQLIHQQQATGATMKRLHQQIAAERSRRTKNP
ncbi:low affinity iron permease family protein [Candidatus Saccharibacteria bacterium]|nr:low affinity iron permease family protein [Candidatus Saccharibacteria bacterium]